MTRPAVAAVTDRLYNSLPEVYRYADEKIDWPLLRWLSGLLDQLAVVDTLVDRFSYTPLGERWQPFPDGPIPWRRWGDLTYGDGSYGDTETSDLVDPRTADAGWLPWLAQLVGVDVTGLTVAQQRTAIVYPSTSWAHGTPDAIAAQAKVALTGTKYVDVRACWGGDPWTIAVVTKNAETPGGYQATLDAIGERPAGYKLLRVSFESL